MSDKLTLNSMTTLGKFEVGQEVRLKNRKAYGGLRTGHVVEVTPTRIRVLWDALDGVTAKRTWMAPKALVQVIRGGSDPFPDPADQLPGDGDK